jgi:N-acetyl-anhydromuramyl-L-alanine amidase AmpD
MDTPFLQARWFTPVPIRAIDLVVIHDMEMPEKGDTAEACARMFSTTDRKASAHFTVDNNSVVQCVKLMDVAWHAPGANHQGIGIEHAGYAKQTERDWADDYSEKMLQVSAALTSDLCRKFGLPHAFVDEDGLQAGYRGFTTHYEVSKAWHLSDHTDPGPNFPMGHYLDLVHDAAGPQPILQEARPVVNAPVVTIIAHAAWNGGYIEVGADGGTFSWAAPNFGSTGSTKLNSPVVAAAVTPTGQGYWLVAADGGVFAFGDAGFHGSMGGTVLNRPVVGVVSTPSGQGYWLVASDGGIFSFGDATFHGAVEFQG